MPVGRSLLVCVCVCVVLQFPVCVSPYTHYLSQANTCCVASKSTVNTTNMYTICKRPHSVRQSSLSLSSSTIMYFVNMHFIAKYYFNVLMFKLNSKKCGIQCMLAEKSHHMRMAIAIFFARIIRNDLPQCPQFRWRFYCRRCWRLGLPCVNARSVGEHSRWHNKAVRCVAVLQPCI